MTTWDELAREDRASSLAMRANLRRLLVLAEV